METAHLEANEGNGCESTHIVSLDTGETVDLIDEEEESESQCLLPPRKGGMSRNCERTRRSVQWNDNNGNNLVEVLVYEPSEASEDEEDETDSCICIIM